MHCCGTVSWQCGWPVGSVMGDLGPLLWHAVYMKSFGVIVTCTLWSFVVLRGTFIAQWGHFHLVIFVIPRGNALGLKLKCTEIKNDTQWYSTVIQYYCVIHLSLVYFIGICCTTAIYRWPAWRISSSRGNLCTIWLDYWCDYYPNLSLPINVIHWALQRDQYQYLTKFWLGGRPCIET